MNASFLEQNIQAQRDFKPQKERKPQRESFLLSANATASLVVPASIQANRKGIKSLNNRGSQPTPNFKPASNMDVYQEIQDADESFDNKNVRKVPSTTNVYTRK